MYEKVLTLSELVGSTEQRPRAVDGGIGITLTPTDSVVQYWKRTVAIPFLGIIFTELKSHFSKENQAHYKLCVLIPTVIVKKSKEAMAEIGKVLQQK